MTRKLNYFCSIYLFVILALIHIVNAQTKTSRLSDDFSSKPNIENGTNKTSLANLYQLAKDLKKLSANTYTWTIGQSLTDWDDLHTFLPEAKIAGVTVCVNLMPPSKSPPICSSCNYSEPYRLDYMLWAQEIANLSLRYSNLKEFTIDDIQENLNLGYLTQSYLNNIEAKGKSINPKLEFVNVSSVTASNNYYVDKDAAGNGSGSNWTNAATSISALNWNNIDPGDTIYISGGTTSKTYPSTLSPKGSGTADKKIIITRGKDPGHSGVPIFNGNSSSLAMYIQNRNNIEVSYLQFENGKTGNIVVAVSKSSNIDIKHCKIIHPTAQAISIEGGSYNIKILSNIVTTGEVTNNYETDFVWMGDDSHNIEIAYNYVLEQNSGTGHKDIIQSYNASNAKIHHNFFAHYRNGDVLNYTGNIALYSFSGLAQIYNNIVVYNGVIGNALILVGGGSAEVYNNTCYMISGDRITEFENLSSLKMKNNLLYGSVSNPIWLNNVSGQDISNNLSGTNFNFVGGDLTDPHSFNVNNGSKIIDAGVSVTLFNDDYFGTARPIGNAWDIGAVESQ